ncbi:hypothetical protein HDV01_001850 [Terramyces sp. JEL0728]|nr:hypothetical protein HDV01_001850 [Terramyces sp. JEL0728]
MEDQHSKPSAPKDRAEQPFKDKSSERKKKLKPPITTPVEMPQRKQCPSCPLSFIRTEHLVRHSYVHSGIKPFQCSICNRGFSRLDALQRHSRIHNTPGKKKSLSPKATTELIESKIPLSLEVEGMLECASSLVKLASRKTIAIENLIN